MDTKILIVDDEEAVRKLLVAQIISLRCTPLTANNGLSALAQMCKDSVDVVLLDVVMPGMNGYEVLEEMKRDKVLRNTPVKLHPIMGANALRRGAEESWKCACESGNPDCGRSSREAGRLRIRSWSLGRGHSACRQNRCSGGCLRCLDLETLRSYSRERSKPQIRINKKTYPETTLGIGPERASLREDLSGPLCAVIGKDSNIELPSALGR